MRDRGKAPPVAPSTIFVFFLVLVIENEDNDEYDLVAALSG
jgi:hypothetical protein